MNKIKKAFKNPRLIVMHMCRKWPFYYISDKAYLNLFYRTNHGKNMNWETPVTFNEKLQWLKLYDRRPEYVDLTDKLKVRDFVRERIGEEYLVPIYGSWTCAEEIPYDELPEKFVLKCNHDSGSVVICENKSALDKKKAAKKLNKALKYDYYRESREYNYHGIEPRIMAEQYLSNDGNDELTDYKFFCFDGEPKFIQVDTGRFKKHIRNFYDAEWNFIDVENGCEHDEKCIIEKPEQLEKMLALAKELSAGFPHVRVDFYYSSGRIYFGELTFHHGGGAMAVSPHEYDVLWGSYITLPEKTQ